MTSEEKLEFANEFFNNRLGRINWDKYSTADKQGALLSSEERLEQWKATQFSVRLADFEFPDSRFPFWRPDYGVLTQALYMLDKTLGRTSDNIGGITPVYSGAETEMQDFKGLPICPETRRYVNLRGSSVTALSRG